MFRIDFTTWRTACALMAGLLVLKVVASVLLSYPDYFPPNFSSDFLLGRESHFFGSYQWAFNVHVVAGPLSLLLGLVLISSRFRQRLPQWHRRLGRVQAVAVLLLVTPSGFWMAFYAIGGPIAATGFAVLSVCTAFCMALGWRAAVQRRYRSHEHWMWRCYLLLCSAVIIRMIGGFAVTTGLQSVWIDPIAAWACWVMPLAGYELYRLRIRRVLDPSVLS